MGFWIYLTTHLITYKSHSYWAPETCVFSTRYNGYHHHPQTNIGFKNPCGLREEIDGKKSKSSKSGFFLVKSLERHHVNAGPELTLKIQRDKRWREVVDGGRVFRLGTAWGKVNFSQNTSISSQGPGLIDLYSCSPLSGLCNVMIFVC